MRRVAAPLSRAELAGPLLLAVVAQVELRLPYGLEGERVVLAHSIVLLLVTVPLVWRRRAPLVVALVVAVSWAVAPVVAAPTNTFVGGLCATLGPAVVVVLGARGWRQAAGRAVLVVGLVGAQGLTDPRYGWGGAVSNVAFALVGCAGAAGWRRNTERADRSEAATASAEARTEQALVEERARIARELHDIVAHSISVMLLQARGGRRMLAVEPTQAGEALTEIERVAGQALEEMRLLLGMLRADDGGRPTSTLAPQPGLRDLAGLLEHAEATGTPTSLRVRGDPAALPPAQDTSCYRIVQEGVTNALKHAPGAALAVEVAVHRDRVEVCVHNGPAAAPPRASGTGIGLVGMRERVELFGGALEHGRQPEGGFLVRARLPLSTPLPRSAAALP